MKVVSGHFVEIKFSIIFSFSELLLRNPVEDMLYKNEEENKNRVKYRIQETRDQTQEREVSIPRA